MDRVNNGSLLCQMNCNISQNTTQQTTVPVTAVSFQVWKYVSPILLIVGTVGNVLSLMVLLRKKLRKLTSSRFFIMLSFVDMFVLYIGIIPKWIQVISSVYIVPETGAACAIYAFLFNFSHHLSAWMIVLLTLERFAAVYFPFKVKIICSIKSGWISMCVGFVLMIFPSVHFLLFYGNYENNFNSYAHFMNNYWQWIDISLSFFIPFVIIFLCNTAIIVKLVSRRCRRSNTLSLHVAGTRLRNITQLTVTLLTVNIVYILTTSPIRVLLLTPAFKPDKNGYYELYVQNLFDLLTLLVYVNNCINFMLYYISGERFRQELRALLFCKY